MSYRAITGPRGTRYLYKGKLIKTADVPADIMEQLKDHASAEVATEPQPKACIFCGAYGRFTRFVNLQTIYLCEEHYYSESIGKIVHKLKESEDG